MRIIGRAQRRDRSFRVATVPFGDVLREGGEINTNTLVFQLLIAPSSALFRGRCEEHFCRGIGEHVGAHVAPVCYQSRGPTETPLKVEKRLPNGGYGGHFRRQSAGFLGSQAGGNILAIQPDLLVSVVI